MKSRMQLSRLVLAIVLSGSVPAFAVDWKSLHPQGYVSDFAGVIDAQHRAAIEAYADSVKQATKAELAFVTIPSLRGEPIEDVANDLFHAWGIGRKGEDDGALVLLSIQDRKSRLEVGGGLGGSVPDGMAGLLLDDMRPALRAGDYGSAMLAAAVRLGGAIAQSKGVTIEAPRVQYRRRPQTQDRIPWQLIFFGIFLLIMLMRRGGGGYGGGYSGGGGGFWTGMLLGALLDGGRGRRGGGGFGGFDSGGGFGGFGGFGGGDSGGGGASSDW